METETNHGLTQNIRKQSKKHLKLGIEMQGDRRKIHNQLVFNARRKRARDEKRTLNLTRKLDDFDARD